MSVSNEDYHVPDDDWDMPPGELGDANDEYENGEEQVEDSEEVGLPQRNLGDAEEEGEQRRGQPLEGPHYVGKPTTGHRELTADKIASVSHEEDRAGLLRELNENIIPMEIRGPCPATVAEGGVLRRRMLVVPTPIEEGRCTHLSCSSGHFQWPCKYTMRGYAINGCGEWPGGSPRIMDNPSPSLLRECSHCKTAAKPKLYCITCSTMVKFMRGDSKHADPLHLHANKVAGAVQRKAPTHVLPKPPGGEGDAEVAKFARGVRFLGRVQETFESRGQHGVFAEFMGALSKYQSGAFTVGDAIARVEDLLQGHPELFEQFLSFVSPNIPRAPQPPRLGAGSVQGYPVAAAHKQPMGTGAPSGFPGTPSAEKEKEKRSHHMGSLVVGDGCGSCRNHFKRPPALPTTMDWKMYGYSMDWCQDNEAAVVEEIRASDIGVFVRNNKLTVEKAFEGDRLALEALMHVQHLKTPKKLFLFMKFCHANNDVFAVTSLAREDMHRTMEELFEVTKVIYSHMQVRMVQAELQMRQIQVMHAASYHMRPEHMALHNGIPSTQHMHPAYSTHTDFARLPSAHHMHQEHHRQADVARLQQQEQLSHFSHARSPPVEKSIESTGHVQTPGSRVQTPDPGAKSPPGHLFSTPPPGSTSTNVNAAGSKLPRFSGASTILVEKRIMSAVHSQPPAPAVQTHDLGIKSPPDDDFSTPQPESTSTDVDAFGRKRVREGDTDLEGPRLKKARDGWRSKSMPDALTAKYGHLLERLSLESGQRVVDAINMQTRAHKHKAMHVELCFMLECGIIERRNEEGTRCPLARGVRGHKEPSAARGNCAFGGWKGLMVLKPEEFISRWAELFEMHRCPAVLHTGDACTLPGCAEGRRSGKLVFKEHMVGLETRDWLTVTESLSTQKHKFGLVPKEGGKESWTNAFRGLTPLVFRGGGGATGPSDDLATNTGAPGV